MVDTDSKCLAVKRFRLKTMAHVSSNRESFVKGDLSTVLELVESSKLEYIFPTAPVHLAADLAKVKFDLESLPDAINTILPKLPQVVVLQSGKGKIVASFNRDADCVEKCTMPKICPSSRIRKPCTMIELFRFACPDAFILISYSMAPGMGALKGKELLEFLNWAKSREDFVVATVCDCHGVLNAFKKRKTAQE